MKFCDGRVLIIRFDAFSQQIIVNWSNCSNPDPSMYVDSFGLEVYFFQTEEYLAFDSSELRACFFSFDLLGMTLGPTIFEVTSGYSMSENDFFLRDRHLFAE